MSIALMAIDVIVNVLISIQVLTNISMRCLEPFNISF